MKNVTVIGGSGFIGSRLCSILEKDNVNFSIIDKKIREKYSHKTVIADIRLIDDLRRSVSANTPIIHLAAEHSDNVTPKSLYDDVNIGGAFNICQIADEKNINTIIFTSSVAVYGFAPSGTNENGAIDPFGDYGRTKFAAEQVFKKWYEKNPQNRTLVIIRPTVVFGEANRGNVYNLLKQIASGNFLMVGSGENKKSLAYVENVASFLKYSINLDCGIHIFNYIDKPDYTMNLLVAKVLYTLGKKRAYSIQIPYCLGLLVGYIFDLLSIFLNKKYSISSIRIKKFCAESVYDSAIFKTGFIPPVQLEDAIEQTVRYEFTESHEKNDLFFSE
jgi:nucleoside-diphosphate-sugar epimerase